VRRDGQREGFAQRSYVVLTSRLSSQRIMPILSGSGALAIVGVVASSKGTQGRTLATACRSGTTIATASVWASGRALRPPRDSCIFVT
jgi:hypothetical protein